MSVSNKVEIQYKTARFYKRVLANLLDFIAFVFVAVALFLGVRGIVTSTPSYQANSNRYDEIRTDSGLYVASGSNISDLITFLRSSSMPYSTKCNYVEGISGVEGMDSGIPKFIDFLYEEVSVYSAATVTQSYDEFRLNATITVNGEEVHYYVMKDGEITRNLNDEGSPNGWTYQQLFDNVLVPYVDEHAQGYLMTLVPEYLSLVRFETTMLLAVEIPIAYLLAGILIYLVPPLIMKRGKMTLGKAAYQIGLADSRLLSCSWKRYLARWFILFFGEFVLSIFTFGIPFIVSFTLMSFSKNHQGLPDYMLGLFEVDCREDKLYMSYEEITLKGVGGEKDPIPFRMINED